MGTMQWLSDVAVIQVIKNYVNPKIDPNTSLISAIGFIDLACNGIFFLRV